jgi:hypothetical protein
VSERDRLLVVDADLPNKLAGSLAKRGRRAISAKELGLADNVKDPELLEGLAKRYGRDGDWVLVTGDDAMPAEHGQLLIQLRATVATITPARPEDVREHEWSIDVTQRWAHSMQKQAAGTVRRYTFDGSKPWTPRRRHTLLIAKQGLDPWRLEDAQRAAKPVADAPTIAPPDRFPGFS